MNAWYANSGHAAPAGPGRANTAFALAVALVLAVTGCSKNGADMTTAAPSTTTGEFSTSPVRVHVVKAELTTLRATVDLVGSIVAIPEKTAVISPQQGGWVQQVAVVEGQLVQKGDLLVELDPRAARVAVQKADAVVAEKQAALQRLMRGYLPQEIAAAREDVQKAQAPVESLDSELAALKGLLDRGEISSVVYENKVNALEAAKASAGSAREKFKLLQAGTPPEMIAEGQALLHAAEADLKQGKLTLEWCTITSPIDGVVTQLIARQGQFFDRAAPLATIIDLSNVFAQLSIPSADFTKIKTGTPVEVKLNSLPDKAFQGTIARISGQADPLTGNVIVFTLIHNDDHLLLPGLSCQTRVFLPAVTDALAIPTAALADNSGTPVVTVIKDGKAYETKVEVGATTHDKVQILAGLAAGDVVATAGGYGLPEACPVQVVTDSSTATSAGRGRD